jgi:NAD(P)H-binding
MSSPVRILLVGATGKTGLEVAHQLSENPSKPSIHAICRDIAKLQKATTVKFDTVSKGDASKADDIEAALLKSEANWIIVCIGQGMNLSKDNHIRTENAEATVEVLQQPEFKHVRVLVVSSSGAGKSRIIVGWGIGVMISYYLRHVLKDHTGQELAFQKIANRTTIVNSTILVEKKPVGSLVSFGDDEESPMTETHIADLAAWIVNELCGMPTMPGGGLVNVSSSKDEEHDDHVESELEDLEDINKEIKLEEEDIVDETGDDDNGNDNDDDNDNDNDDDDDDTDCEEWLEHMLWSVPRELCRYLCCC